MTSIEFLATFPIFLVILSVFCQLALLFVGQMFVDMAAFKTARSAIVWIPRKVDDEAPNRIAESGPKMSKLESACSLALAPATPAMWTLAGPSFGGAPQTPVDLSEGSLLRRTLLARQLLEVKTDKTSYAAQDPVSVEVVFHMPLRIPIAARIFGKHRSGGIYTKRLTGRATLLNQGRNLGLPE